MLLQGRVVFVANESARLVCAMPRRAEGVRALAKQLGCWRTTVRRYLRELQASRYGPRAARACKLDDDKDYLLARPFKGQSAFLRSCAA
jgi:hypothetical protein